MRIVSAILLLVAMAGCQSQPNPFANVSAPVIQASGAAQADANTAMQASKHQSHVYGVFFWAGGAMVLAGIITAVFLSRGLGINLIIGGVAIVLTAYLLASYALYAVIGCLCFAAGHAIPFQPHRKPNVFS